MNCAICGQVSPLPQLTHQVSSQGRLSCICKALGLTLGAGQTLDDKVTFGSVCSSCNDIGDRLSTILTQIQLLETEYEEKAVELKNRLDEGGLERFRSLVHGENSGKRRPVKKKLCVSNIPVTGRRLTRSSHSDSRANISTESQEIVKLENGSEFKINEENLNLIKVKIEEAEQGHDYEVSLDESFASDEEEIEPNSKRLNKTEKDFEKVVNSRPQPKLDKDFDPDEVRVESSDQDDDENDDSDGNDGYAKRKYKRWKQDKSSGRLWYQDIEVFSLEEGLQCSKCSTILQGSKDYRHRCRMKDHIYVKHLSNFICPICSKKLSKQRNLDDHIKSVHEKSLSFNCEICLKPFTSKKMVRRHRWSHLNAEERQKEIDSGRKPPVTDNYKDKKILQCGTCGKMCMGAYFLKKHEETHVDLSERMTHMCATCGGIYTSAAALRSHTRLVHENNSKVLWLPCLWPGCERKFPKKSKLEIHYRRHTGEKKYFCTEEGCGEGFTQKNMLDVHINKIHKNYRPFPCPSCDMAFFKSHHLKRHVGAYHEGRTPVRVMPYRKEGGITRVEMRKRQKDEESANKISGNLFSFENYGN